MNNQKKIGSVPKEFPMYSITRTMSIMLLTLGLVACGSSTGDRALSGGGLGAAAGAGGAALLGGSLVGGALLGGAAGAIIGGVTEEDDIDLGRPVWK